MLSKKMAFSLMRFITIFALAFAVSPAMAAEFTTTLSYNEAENVEGRVVDVTLAFDKVVSLAAVQAKTVTVVVVKEDFVSTTYTITGGTAATANLGPIMRKDMDASTTGGQHGGKTFTFTVPVALLPRSDPDAAPPVAGATKIYVSIPMGIPTLDPGNADTSQAATLAIDLRTVSAQDRDTPTVVSIQRLRPSSQTVTSAFQEAAVTGPFDVRIVFTEKPHDFKLDHINVEGGTVSNLVVGVPFAGVPAGVRGQVPLPTGPDGLYHQYRVTITPHRRVNMVKVSIKEFHDNASPYKNYYQPINLDGTPNGREEQRLPVATDIVTPGAGSTFHPPHEEGTQGTDANGTPEYHMLTKAEEEDTSVSIPEVGQIYISEIMFAGGGVLPQWIEIANGSRTEEVNLGGWTLTVENTTADADVGVGSKATFTIAEGMKLYASGQHDTPSTILVVTEQGRTNIDAGGRGARQIFNLWTEQQVVLFLLDVTKRRYSLLSEMAFKITLSPPAALITPAAADAMDVVGNLGADGAAAWTLPMEPEGDARSSIIRRHVQGAMGAAEPKDGTMMASWVLASDTSFAQSTHLSARSYYGLPIDVGTPGFRAGGALPVELSHFRPARNKDTGTVVITWSTQSELNNAGFFVKRSQQRDGQFKVINATMIPGAGTTSEKQFYTYTDTTAQPNVVYYYQIEDVSFDGNRQTLTRGIRLKGHVGAAGKATTTWGELKISSEL